MTSDARPVTRLNERQLRQGKSPVWGGLTLALVVGVVAYAVASFAGWDATLTAFRSATAIYVFLAVTSWPSWLISRRAGRIAPLTEPVGEALISLAFIWVAFFRPADLPHSVGWVFVAAMIFAVLEAYGGRKQFLTSTASFAAEAGPVADERRGTARSYFFLACIELVLATIAVVLLTR